MPLTVHCFKNRPEFACSDSKPDTLDYQDFCGVSTVSRQVLRKQAKVFDEARIARSSSSPASNRLSNVLLGRHKAFGALADVFHG
jgi:hypothetical protein